MSPLERRLSKLALLAMVVAVTAVLLRADKPNDVTRMVLAFAAFTMIATFIAITPGKMDDEMLDLQKKSEAHLGQMAELLERESHPPLTPAPEKSAKVRRRTVGLLLFVAVLFAWRRR